MEVTVRPSVLLAALLVASSTALAAAPASAASMDAPKRKSGLWEIKISNPQMKGGHMMQQCVDQKSDDLITKQSPGTDKMTCSKNEFRKEGDKIVADSVCKMGGSTATTHAVFTGKFDSAYKADIQSTYDPPMHGMRESSSVLEAKWLGACLPGQKPGDVMMPGMPGGMQNMEELMKQGQKKQ
jgi:Protein of unknown function (DUF3617)